MRRRLSVLLTTVILILCVAVGAGAQTEIGAAAPTEPLGGQPAPGVTQSAKDLDAQVAYQRAFEAVLLELPGMADNVILSYSGPLRTIQEAITPNQVTPYICATSDLRNGPVVLEVPAKTNKAVLYGQVVDAWQVTITGVGPVGEDKGAGGKYLSLPPAYKDPIPSGYFPIQSSSYRILLGFLSIPLGDGTAADASAYGKRLKMYPLSEAANPKPTRFVDGLSLPVHTLPFYDSRALQDMHDIISVEPVQSRDKVMMGMLATIGIERGKPFNLPEKYKTAM